MPNSPRWVRSGASLRGGRCGDRLRHRSRQSCRIVRLGWPNGDQACSPARDDSYEGRSGEAHIAAFFLETGPGQAERVRTDLAEPLLERAIGVIYRPETELLSHYFQAELSRQFDAWIWFTETSAVATQEITAYAPGPDETYPFGL
jgi:erythromycin esterase-like protein